MRTAYIAAVAAASALALAGCGSSGAGRGASSAPLTPATHPVTLKLAMYDAGTSDGGMLAQHFADAVHASDPSITVKTTFEAAEDDEAVIKLIQAGGADLGVVPTRAWDLVGVTSLRAINTPFLIDSNNLLNSVVQAAVAEPMLAGLSKAGVTGLGLLPDGLRHPYGVDKAPLSPADYRGKVIRAPHSQTGWAVLTALGAKPVWADHGYSIAESSWEFAPGPEGVGNVTLYARADAVVLGDAAKAKLGDRQVAALKDAAASTATWAATHLPTDDERAAKFCADGGTIVAADPAALAALKTAAEPVVTEMKKDPDTAAAIDAIEELKSSVAHQAPLTSCAGKTRPTSAGDVSELNGTYRSVVTVEDLKKAGITEGSRIDPGPILDLAPGEYVMTFQDGAIHVVHTLSTAAQKGETDEWDTRFTLEGDDTFTIHWGVEVSNIGTFTKVVEKDGSLTLTIVKEGNGDPKDLILDGVTWHYLKRIK